MNRLKYSYCVDESCAVDGTATWGNIALGGFIGCLPVFIVLFLKYRRDGGWPTH